MGHTLSAAKFGFSSLLELLNDLVEVVHLERKHEMGDWTISHISVAKQKSMYSCGFLRRNKTIFCYAWPGQSVMSVNQVCRQQGFLTCRLAKPPLSFTHLWGSVMHHMLPCYSEWPVPSLCHKCNIYGRRGLMSMLFITYHYYFQRRQSSRVREYHLNWLRWSG